MPDPTPYLARLGLPSAAAAPPTAEGLFALHRAQVERIAYEALDIQLGIVNSIEPQDSFARVAERGRGGYCYHLNGAFSVLLDALGYDVVWHRAGVQNHSEPGPVGAHLVLTVHGLPSAGNPAGDWLVDCGSGDVLYEPLPLRPGTYEQGPFTYRLSPSVADPGGWRMEHDPAGSFAGFDFRAERATVADFLDRHRFLSTSPDSDLVRTCIVLRRDAGGVDSLRGRVLTRWDGTGTTDHTIDTRDDWFAVLSDRFGITLTDLDADAHDHLWARVDTTHQAWLAGRQPAD